MWAIRGCAPGAAHRFLLAKGDPFGMEVESLSSFLLPSALDRASSADIWIHARWKRPARPASSFHCQWIARSKPGPAFHPGWNQPSQQVDCFHCEWNPEPALPAGSIHDGSGSATSSAPFVRQALLAALTSPIRSLANRARRSTWLDGLRSTACIQVTRTSVEKLATCAIWGSG